LGNHLGKWATGKNGNGKLGNQFTVNGIHLKESTHSVALFTGCPFFRGPNFRCPLCRESTAKREVAVVCA